MKKQRYSVLLALCGALLVVWSGALGRGGPAPVSAQAVDPQQALAQAWARVRGAGSYRFLSTAEQTLVPRPIPAMIGQGDVHLTLEHDGAVILPQQAYVALRVASAGRARSVALLRDGNQSFMLQDGALTPVDDALSLASPTSDVLGYLAAAEQVTLMDPPDGHPDLVRYGFAISGPRFAEYVRQQAEADMRSDPGAPEGLTLRPAPALQEITGHGELWVNRAGLPVRQVLDIRMPEVNEHYGAQIHVVADLSTYGEVESLPRAAQRADGTWGLEGTLTIGGAAGATQAPDAPGAPLDAPSAPTVAGMAAWHDRFSPLLPLRVDPSALVLFLVTAVGILVARYYRRNPRHCYTLIALFLVPVLVFSSLLQAGQLLLFVERQAQASERSAAATPSLLRALGLEVADTPSDDATGEARAAEPASGGQTDAPTAGRTGAPARAVSAPAVADRRAGRVALQAEAGQTALARCGDGEPGADTDGDGIDDRVELCLGTNANNPDSDTDGIDDRTELLGFDLGGRHWDSDPLSPDSNRDGIMDSSEWSRDLAAHGDAANADLDGDGIPNLWDDDDDADGVPDALDLSPAAMTDYTTEFSLSTSGQIATGTQAIEIEVQPQDLEHLRYSTTALDWPLDEEGNIQDLDNSTADLRLLPYLLVTTNIAPDQELLAQYGVRSWVTDDGQTILLVTMQPLEDGGAIHAFYGKVAYGAAQTGDIQWSARLVWMAEMQQDRWGWVPNQWGVPTLTVIPEPLIIHQYQDAFRVTGLQITKSERYEAMVLGTPGMAWDDRYLFQLLLGLSSTFASGKTLEGQDELSGETALGEIAARFAPGYAGDEPQTFHLPAGYAAVNGPVVYPNAEAAMAGLSGEQLPQFLNGNGGYTSNLCAAADGATVTCASVLVAAEAHAGVEDLSSLADPNADPRIVALDRLHVDLGSVPLVVARTVNMRMYERDGVTETWRPMLPARMLEIVEARYGGAGGAYETTLAQWYPALRSGDWRFIAYSVYLWAYGGRMLTVSVDGQVLVPEYLDEDTLVGQYTYTLPDTSISTALAYMGVASGIPSIITDSYAVFNSTFGFVADIVNRAEFIGTKLGNANLAGHLTLSGLAATCSLASVIMGSINTVCASNPDRRVCQNEVALLAANLAIGSLTIIVQTTAIVYSIAEAIVKNLKYATSSINVAGSILGWIGAAVGITMAWVSFGILAAHGSSNPIAWRVALGMAIMTTIWLVALAIINMIPLVGSIISAILGLLDYIIGLFTGLFANEQWSFAKIVLELFYDARLCTSLEAAQFGEFHSSLEDPDLGLVAGNKYILELPGSGTIVKETEGTDNGTDDDLRRSYVRSSLEGLEIDSGFVVSDTTQPDDCAIDGDKLECTNTASLGVHLDARINGRFSIYARMLYATVWAEYTLYAVRVKTHVESGQLPEEDPEPTTVYLDVLPATLSELWRWSALANPDRDGDGLTNDQELALGTDPDRWDTDEDGLSDRYEIETESARGADPLKKDTDGDGLSDALERRAGTRPNVPDSDGDGLTDGEELRHLEGGVLVGGWQIDLDAGAGLLRTMDAGLLAAGRFSVSSDPNVPDDDGDSLNAWEERENGLSPLARNALVPALALRAAPLGALPDPRPGMYWLPGTQVTFTIHLGNWAIAPVTGDLTLTLPSWLDTIGGGVMVGDRSPAMVQNGNILTWSFSGADTLQLYEAVSTTVTARVDPATAGGRGLIPLELTYEGVQMREMLDVIVDGDDPDVAIMAPADGAYLRGAHYVVGGSASDATTWITESSLSIVPQGSPAHFATVNSSTGLWAHTWDLPGDGVYTLEARATDAMQHQRTVGPVTVTVDNTPPVASLSYGLAPSGVRLSGTAGDNLAGVEWVQVAIDGQPWRSVAFDGANWSYDWTVGEGAQGQHVVMVRAIDRAGNESAAVTQEIVVDRVAPSSTVRAGADPDVPVAVRAGSPFSISGVADEGGHLPLPAAPVALETGLDVLADSTVWLGLSSIHDNDGGVLAAWIGDFNADRLADLAVGLPGPEGDGGSVALVYGRAGGWPVPPDLVMLAHSATRYTGAPGARLGSLLAAAGDVNGDGLDDLLIGERASTRAFLVLGKAGVLGLTTLEGGQAGYRTMLRAPATIEDLAAAGDVDGDGHGDLLVTAGGTAYLLLGHPAPWPETLDVAAEAAASWDSVTGARGLGDVDYDQRAEWATLSGGAITLYGWNTGGGVAERAATVATADMDPRVVALGDVDGDAYADWLYADGASRVLVYGGGASPHTFSDLDGLFAAPGDVDGDGRADLLLTTAAGVATLIRQPAGGSPEVFATVAGVGGAAVAPYAAGADLNADGSADLLLIPSRAAAEARGFDAPDFSSGFISPLALPLGATVAGGEEGEAPLRARGMGVLSIGPDTRYVDDDAVGGVCDGHSGCFRTIQAAVDASDGGGDTIIVYPGVYASFRVPAGANYDHLTIQGVSADAVFVEGGAGDAIRVAADGVHLSHLTLRDARVGVALENGAGAATWAGGDETAIDHLLVHSVESPIAMSQSAALRVQDSTLVANGTDPLIAVGSTPDPAVHTWRPDLGPAAPIGMNGALVSNGGALYALPGGTDNTVYTATPGSDGALGAWAPAFRLQHDMPQTDGTSALAAGGNYLYQMHPYIATPDFGTFGDGQVRAVAVAPNGDIYVGGQFNQIGGTVGANNIARWDGAQWHPLGTPASNGVDGTVHAITIVSSGDVYVGGQFSRVFGAGGQVPAANIARWNGSQWLTLGTPVVGGNGVTGEAIAGESIPPENVAVYALTHTDDDVVVVGGRFRRARESTADHVNVWNSAFYHPTRWLADYNSTWWQYGGAGGGVGWNDVNACIRSMVWGGGLLEGTTSPNYTEAGILYAGGTFTQAGNYAANNVARFQFSVYGGLDYWHPFGGGIPTTVADVAWDAAASTLYAVSDDPAATQSFYWWDGTAWASSREHTQPGDVTVLGSALAVDARGNVYAGMANGNLYVRRAGDSNWAGWSFGVNDGGRRIWDLAMDGRGQVLTARGAAGGYPGNIKRWAIEGLLRRDLSGATWETFPYPLSLYKGELPTAVVADGAGNAYVAGRFGSYYVVYRFNAATRDWHLRATLPYQGDPDSLNYFLRSLTPTDAHLYGLAYAAAGEGWYLFRHNPAAADVANMSATPSSQSWTSLGPAPLPAGAGTATNLSWTWDGADSIYVLAAGHYYRYRIGANVWDTLPNPSVAFTVSHAPALARAGNHLYAYVTPGTGVTTNVIRYGAVGLPDLRLTLERTALVVPDAAGGPLRWTNLGATEGTYRFLIDADTTNEWVGPSSATWSPPLPAGASRLTSTEAAFVAPVDGLYRLSAASTLTSGYHHYVPVAHVYPSEAACAECAGGSLTWGETALPTVREAVESGAARVLVHPGRYPQTFYLVSGVEVIGSGAESTIIEPPAGPAAALVTAEGAAGATLARLTLAGAEGWDGLVAEGGVEGLTVTRCIFRDLDTALTLREGSAVEVVNNTVVRNANGLVAEGTTPVHVRNTIFAHHTGAGLRYGGSATNTYNAFWGNAVDMDPAEVSLGSLFADPRFRSLAANDLRLAADSPLIDMGAPGDPTAPGGGARVDIGYAWFNAAGFYVSPDYSETGLNDGLTWGIDAFGSIQPALDAAAAALYGLQGAVPEGGYSVAVDAGTYVERVAVPSHVRLVGSGAEVTTIDAAGGESAVTFDGVIDAALSGFTLQNAGAGGAGVDLADAANTVTISRNVIRNSAGAGVRLAGRSSGAVRFNTITGNTDAGVYAEGPGTWAAVYNNILDGNGAGLEAASSALIRNDYNLLHNLTDALGVAVGPHTVTADPAFAPAGHYVLSPGSPALDAADPLVEVPVGGGVRADLGYQELTACPLTLLFGPQVASTVVGNSGVQQVEVALVPIDDATQPVTATLPTAWETLTPPAAGQPLFYWTHEVPDAAPGLYRVYSRATDAAGNREEDEADWYEGALVVDGTAPMVAWGVTLPASTYAAALLAVADVSGAGTRDVDRVYYSVSGPAGTVTYPAVDGKAWIPLPANGTYTIRAVAIDEAGNQAQASATVSVSAVNSVATVTYPAAEEAVNRTTVTLRGFVRFPAGGAGQVEVRVAGGATVLATLDTPGAAFSAWSAEVTLPEGDGAKTVTVSPRQNGVSGALETVHLNLDTTAPALAIATPAEGATARHTVEWAGTAFATGSPVVRVEVSIDGGYTWRPASLDGADWSLTQEFSERQDHVTYPVRVRAVDLAGNVALLERPVALDSVPPADLAPVTFSVPEGQHVEVGTHLDIAWNAPADGSGSAQVLWAVDRSAEADPGAVAGGTGASATLDAVGDWYVHLMARDAAGNEAITHYGPWHVRDMNSATFSARRQSIVLDGFIDLAHAEWQGGDLLGTDAQGFETQRLYASWDGAAIYLGWSGAWWTLDGAMWAYLDVADGGSTQPVSGALTLPFAADVAVSIDSGSEGSLYTWSGSDWALAVEPLAFRHGPSGDSEARIPWALSDAQTVRLVAFALPPETETGMRALSAAGGASLASSGGGLPWAIFPNTNPLGQDPTGAYLWNTPNVGDMNAGQPTARTVLMDVDSPQAGGTAWCPGSTIVYRIALENPEATACTDLTIALAATAGLGYQSVDGALLAAGAVWDGNWTLSVPALEPGGTASITVTARLAGDLSGLEEVTSTFSLSSASSSLTGATVTAVPHRVDGAAPTVAIDAPAGSAIAAGLHTFTGTSDDGTGSGVASVEVSLDGGATWRLASGTRTWAIALDVPGGGDEATLLARAVDGCGRATEPAAERTFTIDRTPPTLSWAVPAVITATAALLAGSTADPAPAGALVERVEVQVDADTADWLLATGPYAPLGGAQGWTWTWRPPQDDGVAHTLRARATDGAGNETATAWQQAIVDVVAPVVTVTQAPTSDSPLLRATADDGSGVAAVRIRRYDPLGGSSLEDARLLVTGDWEYAPDLAGWSPGAHALWVEASDIYGNLRVAGPYPLVLEVQPIVGLAATNDGPRRATETVTLTATLGAGDYVTYAWDLGDGATAEGPIVPHAYARPGEYTAVVTATNSISTMTAATTVIALPRLQVAAGDDRAAEEGETISILATFADAATAAGYAAAIDWGDGTGAAEQILPGTATTVAGSHSYGDDGEYPVTVTVRDRDDSEVAASDTLTATIANVAPTIALSGAPSVEVETPYSLTLGAITDPGADTVTTWTVHWDDGASDTYAAGGDVTHTYATAPASPVITVDLTDEDGTHLGAGSLGIAVTLPPIAVEAGEDLAAEEGETVTILAAFTDAESPRAHTATIDWGDGASGDGSVDEVDRTVTGSHVYPDDGPYTVTVTVGAEDGDGASDALTVTVANVAPTIALDGAASVDEGAVYTLTLSEIADPGDDTVTEWLVDWGDGEEDAYASGGDVTHTYADGPDNPAITVDLRDEDGRHVAAGSATVAVYNVAPTIALSGDDSVVEGLAYTLTLGAITDPGVDTVTGWAVAWGDGASDAYSAGGNVTHTYACAPCSPVILVDLSDEDGTHPSAGSLSITVAVPPPIVVDAGDDQTIEESGTVSILASFTDEVPIGAHSATIDWGDGGAPEDAAVDEATYTVAASHAYPDSGAYTVTVTVRAEGGNVASGALTVTVHDVAPTIALRGDGVAEEGAAYTLTLGEITDPGEDTVTEWLVDWGDGASPTRLTAETYPLDGVLTHRYADGPSAPLISVDLVDDDGTHEEAGSLSVTIHNVVPTIALAGAPTVDEGAVYTLTLGEIADPGDDTVTAWRVTWGDGEEDVYTSGGDVAHIYADGLGSLTIGVALTDEDGAYEDAGRLSLTVHDAAPVVTADPARQVVQYSDPIAEIACTATDGAADALTAAPLWSEDGVTFTPGLPDGLALDPEPACTAEGGLRTCTWRVSGVATVAVGAHWLRIAITDDDGAETAYDVEITVDPEEAVVAFAAGNPVALQVAEPGAASGPFALHVCVTDGDAARSGDISLAEVRMTLVPAGAGDPIDGEGVAVASDEGTLCVTFSFDQVPVNSYTVRVAVGGGYYMGSAEDVLTVHDANPVYTMWLVLVGRHP